MVASVESGERPGLLELIEERIRLTTSNRVRGLQVELEAGLIVLRGQVATRHARQLALHAALEFVSGDKLSERIQVC